MIHADTSRPAASHCRGIRRMCPLCQTSGRERALSVRLTERPRMAHCLRAKKKEVSDFLVIGYLYLELNLNFIYVTSFTCIQLIFVLKYVDGLSAVSSLLLSLV